MKGKGEKQHLERLQNYNLVLEVLKNNLRLKASKIIDEMKKKAIQKQLKGDYKEKIPTLRTVYRVLDDMIERNIVRKESLYYLYAPHDILRKRWLDYFDRIFRAFTAAGYSVEEFLDSQAFIITPRNLGFTIAKPEQLKKLVDGLWNPEVLPGEMIMLARASGKIQKYAPVRLIRKDEKRGK
jgi:hypothetical protein